MGIRAALGASRWHLERSLLSENLLLVALGTLGGLALAALLLAQYRALGPALPRLTEVALAPPVLGFAAALALGCGALLAAVGVFGVFGVLAYQVAQRERELGIRQALGADATQIAALVLQRGLTCAALGVAVGSVLTLFLSRGLESLLFEVERSGERLAAGGGGAGLLAAGAARGDARSAGALRQE